MSETEKEGKEKRNDIEKVKQRKDRNEREIAKRSRKGKERKLEEK